MATHQKQTASAIRLSAGINTGDGPDDEHIGAAVAAFVETFDFRYIKVCRESVRKYRAVIIGRINPLLRRFQLEGLSATEMSDRLVSDWAARNFVTAGGFAIEALGIALSDARKSATKGVDLEWFDPVTNTYRLYVFKSGPVTRNSDILEALKRNTRQAESTLRADRSVLGVTANYAIASGGTSPTTFKDGVQRPSSEDLWSELTGLPPEQAVGLVLSLAAEAGALVRHDAEGPLRALRVVVCEYIATAGSNDVDWGWIETRTMREKAVWKDGDRTRHKAAIEALAAAGLDLDGGTLEAGDAGAIEVQDALDDDDTDVADLPEDLVAESDTPQQSLP